ncbi:MAG: DUF1016 N-terminal domain-containing protein [Proteobacteria bacterium]|nr:DUF1016 N-terminal domain-containing protein [Pseudomonadota bacterium]
MVDIKTAVVPKELLQDLRHLIIECRQDVARTVNSSLVMLYWRVGQRIQKDILKEKRAGYGEEIVKTLSAQLVDEFGNGFSRPNLFRMIRFPEIFPEEKIVSTLSRQLGWSHFVEILSLKEDLQRDFYAEMCRMEGWSVLRRVHYFPKMTKPCALFTRNLTEPHAQGFTCQKEYNQLLSIMSNF